MQNQYEIQSLNHIVVVIPMKMHSSLCLLIISLFSVISDLMRDERNGHSIKISSKGVCAIPIASMVFMLTLAQTILSVMRITTSSL